MEIKKEEVKEVVEQKFYARTFSTSQVEKMLGMNILDLDKVKVINAGDNCVIVPKNHNTKVKPDTEATITGLAAPLLVAMVNDGTINKSAMKKMMLEKSKDGKTVFIKTPSSGITLDSLVDESKKAKAAKAAKTMFEAPDDDVVF